MKNVVLRIIRQMLHDKRSLGLIFFAPLLLLTLMYFLLGKTSYQPVVAVLDIPAPLTQQLEKEDIKLLEPAAITDIDGYLKDKNADAVLYQDGGALTLRFYESDSVKTAKVSQAVKNALQNLSGGSGMEITFVRGDADASVFDSLGYMLLGVLSFFFVFIISGIAFVRERTSGTLERFMLTPVRRSSVVLGYTAGFGLFAAVQSILIVLFTRFVLGMPFAGSFLLVVLTMVLLALTAVSLGTLVSIFANNEFQVMQFIPIIIIPQIFFAGLLPIDTLPYGLNYLAYIMPVYYGSMGLKEILLGGGGFAEVLPWLLVLAGIFAVLFLANIAALKKYRAL